MADTQIDSLIAIEPPVTRSITDWTPSLVRAARASADAGNLELAADFCEWAMGDDRVAASLATRTNGLVSLPLTFEAARGTKRLVKALEAGEDWWASYPASTLAQLLAWSRLLGVAVAYQSWVERGDGINRLIPNITVWHPRHLRFDVERGVWRVKTANKGVIDITPGDGNWIVFTPYGASRPWAFGVWRPISYWRLLKQYAIEDWGKYSSKNAGGWRVATFNPSNDRLSSTKEQRKELAADMFAAQADAALALPQGFDVKMVESTASNWQTFEAQKNAADLANSVALLGQNLSTEVSGPVATGATLHGKVLQVYVEDDNEKLTTCIREQSLRYWAEFNFGNGGLAPWPAYDIAPKEDAKQSAEVKKMRAQTASVMSRVGTFTVNEVREAAGYEPLEQGGDELVKRTPVASNGSDDGNDAINEDPDT
jgi:phage gp29-like protein